MLKDFLQLNNLRGLIMGDYCTDVFVYGSCDRLSPEAPVPVFLESNRIVMDGMAGNVKNNFAQFTDNFDFIYSGEGTEKIRYVDKRSNQQLLRIDKEIDFCELKIPNNLNQYDYFIVSDYCKGSITDKVINVITKTNKPVFVDSKRKDLNVFKDSIIKINEKESKECDISDKNNLVITLGSKGAIWKNKLFETEKVEVRDVSGAGDTFFACFVAKYLCTKSFESSIKFANICASSVVKKSGTSVINLKEII